MIGLPDLLTVEEAARVLRVGRTKAYAMAAEWRATGGRSGLPVVDFGHTLRVPRRALETLIGAPLTASTVAAPGQPSPTPVVAPRVTSRTSSRGHRSQDRDQLRLLDPVDDAD